MICDGCVFHKEISERNQDACALCDDSVESIKACLMAHFYKSCEKRMDREAVRRLVSEHERIKRERDQALVTLAKADEYIDAVKRMIDNLKKGNF